MWKRSAISSIFFLEESKIKGGIQGIVVGDTNAAAQIDIREGMGKQFFRPQSQAEDILFQSGQLLSIQHLGTQMDMDAFNADAGQTPDKVFLF